VSRGWRAAPDLELGGGAAQVAGVDPHLRRYLLQLGEGKARRIPGGGLRALELGSPAEDEADLLLRVVSGRELVIRHRTKAREDQSI
jgi:hypothetical protein